jgi:hypothetical protein
MRKIEFDTINGIWEVEEFNDGTTVEGVFHMITDAVFYLDRMTRAKRVCGMKITTRLFDYLDEKYGIKKL